MTREEFYATIQSPLPNAILKKWPNGNIFQYWAESPRLYSTAFGKHDDFSQHVCGHSGIDIFTFENDYVRAAHDGTVLEVRTDPRALGGVTVYLRSSNYTAPDGKQYFISTSYAHLNSTTMTKGREVKRGDIIGLEGNTGMVVSGGNVYWGNAPAGKGVHLHFGAHEHNAWDGQFSASSTNCLGNSIDPLSLITYKNPDYSGFLVVLQNVSSLLRYWQRKYF